MRQRFREIKKRGLQLLAPVLIVGGILVAILVSWLLAYYLARGMTDFEQKAFEETVIAQRESCERDNDLREEFNHHIDVMVIMLRRESDGNQVLIDSMETLEKVNCTEEFPLPELD